MLAFVGLFYEFALARLLLRDKDGCRLIASRRGCCSDKSARDWGMFSVDAITGAVSTAIIQLTLSGQVVGGLAQGVVNG